VVPFVKAANSPVDGAIVPTAVMLLLQVPPGDSEVSVPEVPEQSVVAPVIPAGNGLTVTTALTWHPVPSVYAITGLPAVTPVTNPKPAIEPCAGLLLVHVPPAGVELSVVVSPTHTLVVPVIADGFGLTVIGVVIRQPVDGNV